MTQPPFTFHGGHTPLLVSMPHVGTYIPESIAADMTSEARTVPDTDWHLAQLYDFVGDMGAGLLVATHSRYVIDLNRDPAGTPLYPGASNSELCPSALFSEAPIYLPGKAPDAAAIAERRRTVWEPYHRKIFDELDRLRKTHGVALLLDAHSIRSEVPRFFPGRLTDLNIGTNDGKSADPALAARLLAVCTSEPSARPPEGGLAPPRGEGAQRQGGTSPPSARPPEGGLAHPRGEGAQRQGGTPPPSARPPEGGLAPPRGEGAQRQGGTPPYTSVLDGRFKGGYITRHYGNPGAGIHAVQLEISERTYMDEEPPFAFDEAMAGLLRPLLRAFVATMLAWPQTAR